MLTPTIMIALLVAPYAVALALGVSAERRAIAGVAGLTAVFLFTGVGHFIKTDAMVQMLPSFLPMRTLAVQITGVIELVAALALLVPSVRQRAGKFLLWLLLLFLPVNIYAALNHLPMGGHAWGPVYLLIRVPLQLLLMIWIYRFALEPLPRNP